MQADKGGRPSIYTQETADEIIKEITRGEPLSRICDRADMPCIATVMTWVSHGNTRKGQEGNEHFEQFLENYIRARESQTDVWVDESIKIVDNDSLDIGFKDDGKGGATAFFDRENVLRSKLRAETRLKVAAMQNAKKYGTQRVEQRYVDKEGNDIAVNINIASKP